MFVVSRAVIYAALFIGLVLIFVPSRVFSSSAVLVPTTIDVWQAAGMLVGATGAALALSCIATFALMGKGSGTIRSTSPTGGSAALVCGAVLLTVCE